MAENDRKEHGEYALDLVHHSGAGRDEDFRLGDQLFSRARDCSMPAVHQAAPPSNES
jgi:hypothetical protein